MCIGGDWDTERRERAMGEGRGGIEGEVKCDVHMVGKDGTTGHGCWKAVGERAGLEGIRDAKGRNVFEDDGTQSDVFPMAVSVGVVVVAGWREDVGDAEGGGKTGRSSGTTVVILTTEVGAKRVGGGGRKSDAGVVMPVPSKSFGG